MKSNPLCMKKILEFVDQNTGVEIEPMDDIMSLKSISLSTVVNEVSKDGIFTAEEVAYNTLLCKKFEFIEASFTQNENVLVKEKCNIFDITIKGEQFLDGKLELS